MSLNSLAMCFCNFSFCFEHRKIPVFWKSKERNCVSRLLRSVISRAPLGQFLILLEASVELIQRWISHLFTIGLLLSLRWGFLRCEKLEEKLPSLQSRGNCFLNWELFTCPDLPFGLSYHSAALNAAENTAVEYCCLLVFY